MSKVIEKKFDAAMMGIYRRALDETNYRATRFLQMLHEHGGLSTAQILLHTVNVSEGYTALWKRKRLDLTVEAMILNPEWDNLFTDEEREIARKRLKDYEYDPPPVPASKP